MGDGGVVQTDALLAGYCKPGSGKIVLSKAILLPVGVWSNTLRRVRRGAYNVLETYAAPSRHAKGRQPASVGSTVSPSDITSPHRAIYEKLVQACALMYTSTKRETELTKRWRVTKGPMTLVDRGAVWEGWAAYVDRGIEMSAKERQGAVLSSGIIDGGVEKKMDEEALRRKREMDELMEEDENEDEEMAG